jgi:hypothetical protein
MAETTTLEKDSVEYLETKISDVVDGIKTTTNSWAGLVDSFFESVWHIFFVCPGLKLRRVRALQLPILTTIEDFRTAFNPSYHWDHLFEVSTEDKFMELNQYMEMSNLHFSLDTAEVLSYISSYEKVLKPPRTLGEAKKLNNYFLEVNFDGDNEFYGKEFSYSLVKIEPGLTMKMPIQPIVSQDITGKYDVYEGQHLQESHRPAIGGQTITLKGHFLNDTPWRVIKPIGKVFARWDNYVNRDVKKLQQLFPLLLRDMFAANYELGGQLFNVVISEIQMKIMYNDGLEHILVLAENEPSMCTNVVNRSLKNELEQYKIEALRPVKPETETETELEKEESILIPQWFGMRKSKQ